MPKYTLLKIRQIAVSKGGACLSTSYINCKTPLSWKCKNGHEWKATLDSITNAKSWCKICKGIKEINLELLISFAKEKGGNCLSRKYKNARTSLFWECHCNFKWHATADSILNRKSWCPKCQNRTPKTIADANTIAQSRGGACLSTTIQNNRTPLTWKCSDGHIWNASYSNVSRGTWCPQCNVFLGEEIVRLLFEAIFDEKFPKTRNLAWLKTPTGNPLELDGYSSKLNLAFEHQGIHHFKNEAYFERSKYDQLKVELCTKNGVKLFLLPQVGLMIKPDALNEVVKKEANRLAVNLPNELPKLEELTFGACYLKNKLEQLKNEVEKKNGKLISTSYLGNSFPLIIECHKKHQWKASPSNIIRKNGSWCPQCFNTSGKRGSTQKLNLKEFELLATERGGKLLSDLYLNSKSKLKFQCGQGHVWEARPVNVKNLNRWCPTCGIEKAVSKRRAKIEDMKSIANLKGGDCISSIYINDSTKLEWKCEKKHIWKATPNNIKQGKWCPFCVGRRKDIIELNKYAQRYGGQCLETKYKGIKKPHKWKCAFGHKWKSTPDAILNKNSWCPHCKKL